MNDFNLNLDLLKCHRAFLKAFTDKRGNAVTCVVIPLADNYITQKKDTSGKSHAYLNLSVWERTNRETNQPERDQWGNSHSVQLQIPKEAREQMDGDQRRAAAVYLGSAKPMRLQSAETTNEMPVSQGDGDLPF